jgi:hypothetical protein
MLRLLVLSCSQRKTLTKGPVPAINRYDGPAFRVLRKYRREIHDPFLTVVVLSAKHGLIGAERSIAYYDSRITRAAASAMRPSVLREARRVLGSKQWEAIGLCASKEYLFAVEGLSCLVPQGVRFDLIRGGLGPRLTGLRDWLRESMTAEDRNAVVSREARPTRHGD